MGEKRVLGRVRCFLPLNSGKNLCFGLAFHSKLTLRASWYAPPDTVGIRFVASCLRIFAINRRCRPDLLVCTFLRGGFSLFARTKRLPLGEAGSAKPRLMRAGEHLQIALQFQQNGTAPQPSSAPSGHLPPGEGMGISARPWLFPSLGEPLIPRKQHKTTKTEYEYHKKAFQNCGGAC